MRGICAVVQATMAAARAMVAGCVSHLPQCVGSTVALASSSVRAAPLRQRAFLRLSVPSVQQSRRVQSCRVVAAEYSTSEEGDANSLEYRMFISDKSGKTVSSPFLGLIIARVWSL